MPSTIQVPSRSRAPRNRSQCICACVLPTLWRWLARLLRKFFQNLRYGRERPKVARKLRSLAGGGVSDTKVAKNDAIVLPSHLYGKLLIPYTVSTYHWERPTLLDPPAFRREALPATIRGSTSRYGTSVEAPVLDVAGSLPQPVGYEQETPCLDG